MKKGIQTRLAGRINVSNAFLCQILKGKRRPSWSVAKRLAKATKTKPDLWLEAPPEKLKKAMATANI